MTYTALHQGDAERCHTPPSRSRTGAWLGAAARCAPVLLVGAVLLRTNLAVELSATKKSAAGVPHLMKYTENQRGFVNAAGTEFKASLWFTSEEGALKRVDIEEALATAACDATATDGRKVHGKFVHPPVIGQTEGHQPFFREKNFGSKISYAPGRCVFDTALDTTKPATVVIPTFKQNIKLALSAYPTQPLDGVAICHAALRAKNPMHPEESSGGSSTYGSWAMNNVNYYSEAAKPGEKPIRSYVFDAREPEVRELDPMENIVTHPEQLTVIKLDVPFKPKRYRLDPANPTATTLSQPDTLAQLAFIRECGDMAKHDGYKWAFFIDYDEYMVVGGGKSIEEFLEQLPKTTTSVIVDRIFERKKPVQEYSSTAAYWVETKKEKLIPFNEAFQFTADNWDFEKGHTAAVGGFPPKYAVNLADAEYDQNPHTYGSPGGIHFPYNSDHDYKHVESHDVYVADRKSEAVIRHLKAGF